MYEFGKYLKAKGQVQQSKEILNKALKIAETDYKALEEDILSELSSF